MIVTFEAEIQVTIDEEDYPEVTREEITQAIQDEIGHTGATVLHIFDIIE